jgi:hypothetical protein
MTIIEVLKEIRVQTATVNQSVIYQKVYDIVYDIIKVNSLF